MRIYRSSFRLGLLLADQIELVQVRRPVAVVAPLVVGRAAAKGQEARAVLAVLLRL